MSQPKPPVAIRAAEAPPKAKQSNYPEPFASMVAGRLKRPLGDVFGLNEMQVMDVAREEFCTIFLLEVRRSNASARRLYESLGFTTLGVRKGYYPNGPGASEDALVMGYEFT